MALCSRCGKEIGDSGVEIAGELLCFDCDMEMEAEQSTPQPATKELGDEAFGFEPASKDNVLTHGMKGDPESSLDPIRREQLLREQTEKDRQLGLALLARRAVALDPSLRHKRLTPKDDHSGNAVGAGLAIIGAVDDDPYAFSAGLSISNRAKIENVERKAMHAARERRVEAISAAMVRAMAAQSKTLDRQPVYHSRAKARWIETIYGVQCDGERITGEILIESRGRKVKEPWRFPVSFDSKRGFWMVDELTTGKA